MIGSQGITSNNESLAVLPPAPASGALVGTAFLPATLCVTEPYILDNGQIRLEGIPFTKDPEDFEFEVDQFRSLKLPKALNVGAFENAKVVWISRNIAELFGCSFKEDDETITIAGRTWHQATNGIWATLMTSSEVAPMLNPMAECLYEKAREIFISCSDSQYLEKSDEILGHCLCAAFDPDLRWKALVLQGTIWQMQKE